MNSLAGLKSYIYENFHGLGEEFVHTLDSIMARDFKPKNKAEASAMLKVFGAALHDVIQKLGAKLVDTHIG